MTLFDDDLRARYSWKHPLAWLRFQLYYHRAKWRGRTRPYPGN